MGKTNRGHCGRVHGPSVLEGEGEIKTPSPSRNRAEGKPHSSTSIQKAQRSSTMLLDCADLYLHMQDLIA